jgi:hypothetical protein
VKFAVGSASYNMDLIPSFIAMGFSNQVILWSVPKKFMCCSVGITDGRVL